ncbi:tyrosine--tRNA ligase [Patescibacteria group bacterium]|nr:tyrosine--tRNA ligase [Patescibacteria group bacterium]
MKKNNINEKAINELLDRSISAIYPSKKELKEKLLSGDKISLYLGIDPTGPSLHLGHAICLNKLAEFQKLGHKIIFLIGSFTAMIGDPTDKNSQRKPLTREQVLENCKDYIKQASGVLDFEGKNPVKILYNSDWHDKLTFSEVISLSSFFTVQQMLERDMFQKRLEEEKAIGLNEFLYPLMQGYDSVVMNVDLELGGNDQIFNMLAGRTLMKKINNKEKFVVAIKLLTDSSGKKMGKSEGNMLTLSDPPKTMFGKVMSWTDEVMVSAFELCTKVPLEEIKEIKEDYEKENTSPRDLKLRLASEVVSLYHGDEVALKEKENFIDQFSNKNLPENIKEVNYKKEIDIITFLTENSFYSSNGEARRMVEQGAIKIHKDSDILKVEDTKFILTKEYNDCVIQAGKRKFLKIKFN